MKPRFPLPLHHSWPLVERRARFDLGFLFGLEGIGGHGLALIDDDQLAAHGIGRWLCDLSDNRLTWTGPVFDIFGLPRGAPLSRVEVAALYCDESRAAMEGLRAHAIRHKRGFTVDTEIKMAGGDRRWMRLLAAPVLQGDRVVRLHGLKQELTQLYR